MRQSPGDVGALDSEMTGEEPSGPEYRIDEMARKARTTVRNVRAYQDRGLLPPPRRQGRVGYYSEAHLVRLKLIGSLIARGYTLANIAELLALWERGQDLRELLGLETALIGQWEKEPPTTIGVETLQSTLGRETARRVIDESTAAGLAHLEEDVLIVDNPRMMEAAATLIAGGMSVTETVAVGETIVKAVEEVAGAYVQLFSRHIADIEPLTPEEVPKLAALVRSLRPLATQVVDAQLEISLGRMIEAEFGERLARMLRDAGGKPPEPVTGAQ